MITFRKHALTATQRFDSRLMCRPRGARAVPRIALTLSILFAAFASSAAAPSGGQDVPGARPAGTAPRTPTAAEAPGEGANASPQVPVKIYLAGTPEAPYLLARIGEFPTELGQPGDEFLQREFIEGFMRDVLGLKGEGSASALKISLLPQADGQEQECSFTFGEVAGRITVRIAPRSVLVLVYFEDKPEALPTLSA